MSQLLPVYNGGASKSELVKPIVCGIVLFAWLLLSVSLTVSHLRKLYKPTVLLFTAVTCINTVLLCAATFLLTLSMIEDGAGSGFYAMFFTLIACFFAVFYGWYRLMRSTSATKHFFSTDSSASDSDSPGEK